MFSLINESPLLYFFKIVRLTLSSLMLYIEWNLYEQVAIAAMDCQHLDVAKVYVSSTHVRNSSYSRYSALLILSFHVETVVVVNLHRNLPVLVRRAGVLISLIKRLDIPTLDNLSELVVEN